MLRGAAKNCSEVIPLTDPDDYPAILASLRSAAGNPNGVGQCTRAALASKAFRASRDYDAAIHALFDATACRNARHQISPEGTPT
ncbi:hypothetical protein [Streptomyces collinus]|uniref:hypothetical protein n=1 Tax=Streptomyces collinus TaxID=42684 RepID=UPI0036897D01